MKFDPKRLERKRGLKSLIQLVALLADHELDRLVDQLDEETKKKVEESVYKIKCYLADIFNYGQEIPTRPKGVNPFKKN